MGARGRGGPRPRSDDDGQTAAAEPDAAEAPLRVRGAEQQRLRGARGERPADHRSVALHARRPGSAPPLHVPWHGGARVPSHPSAPLASEPASPTIARCKSASSSSRPTLPTSRVSFRLRGHSHAHAAKGSSRAARSSSISDVVARRGSPGAGWRSCAATRTTSPSRPIRPGTFRMAASRSSSSPRTEVASSAGGRTRGSARRHSPQPWGSVPARPARRRAGASAGALPCWASSRRRSTTSWPPA